MHHQINLSPALFQNIQSQVKQTSPESEYALAYPKDKRLKIYVYDLPPHLNIDVLKVAQKRKALENIFLQYYMEIYMTEFFLSGGGWNEKYQSDFMPFNHSNKFPYDFITRDPKEADLFFVPMYSSLLKLEQDFFDIRNKSKPKYLDNGIREVGRILNTFQGGKYWKRNHGRDHIFSESYVWTKLIQNFTTPIILTTDALRTFKTWTQNHERFIFLPYIGHSLINIQPKIWKSTKEDIYKQRQFFACFIGSTKITWQHRDVRIGLQKSIEAYNKLPNHQLIKSQYLKQRLKVDFEKVLEIYTDSTFCFVPVGDTAQSKRFFDAFFSLCIPVVISDEIVMPFSKNIPYEEIVVSIPESKFNAIAKSNETTSELAEPILGLLKISKEEIIKRRQLMLQYRQYLGFPPFLTDDLKVNSTVDGLSLFMEELWWQSERIKRYRGYEERHDFMITH